MNLSSLTADYAVLTDSSKNLISREITNNTSATAVTASTNLITANTLYYHKGNSNIDTVGTIGSGTWQGTTVGTAYGGTGNTSYTQWGIVYANPATKLVNTGAGTNGALLQGKGSAAPAWKASANGAVYATSANGDLQWGTLPVGQGGTNRTTLTANAVLYGNGTSAIGMLASANGAVYATAANGALNFGTLPTGQGGTGNTAFTATRMIYSESATKLSSADHIYVLNNYLISNSRNNQTVDIRANGLIIYGPTYGNTVSGDATGACRDLLSNKQGVFRFSDGGPQIIFNTSASFGAQAGALIYTDNDAAATGASFHFVTTESSDDDGGNLTVTAPRFRARKGLAIGQNSDNTTYKLYVNGTSYFNGNTMTVGHNVLRHETYDSSSTTNGLSSDAGYGWFFQDKNGRDITRMLGYAQTNGNSCLYLQVRNYSGSTARSYGGIVMIMDQAGTITYSVTTPANFRSAIGVGASGTHADSFFVQRAGDTMTGALTLKANQYQTDSKYGLNANNSDIIGLNGLQWADKADAFNEGIMFVNGSSGYDCMAAAGGGFYFRSGTDGTPGLSQANATASVYAANFYGKLNGNCTGSSGSCTGNAATATTLQTARNINGTSFNGSANITTANWGTSRTITIGDTGKSVNGSGNVSWSKAEILGSSNTGSFYRGDQTWSRTLDGGFICHAIELAGSANPYIDFHANNSSADYTVRFINAKNDGSTLTLYGSLVYTGTLVHSSSRIIKKDIKNITEEEAKRVFKLRPISYKYQEWFDRFDQPYPSFGFVAEEVLSIMPELVSIPNDYDEAKVRRKEQRPISLKEESLIPYLVKIVQMQQKQIDELKYQVKYLIN